MHHCHHEIVEPISSSLFGIEGLGIVVTLFMTGLIGSFTHCIGMCGPFAVAQTSMRLMNIPNTKLTQKSRLDASALFPYYIGKTLTYCALLTIAYFISENFKESGYYRFLALFFLVSTAFIFLGIAVNKSFNLFKIPYLEKFLSNKIKLTDTRGFRGIAMGMILGLIPCGLVYASIVIAISGAHNYFISLIAMFSFGIATIPGLFIVSYFGQYILVRFKKLLDYAFFIIMTLNALFLLGYALKLV